MRNIFITFLGKQKLMPNQLGEKPSVDSQSIWSFGQVWWGEKARQL